MFCLASRCATPPLSRPPPAPYASLVRHLLASKTPVRSQCRRARNAGSITASHNIHHAVRKRPGLNRIATRYRMNLFVRRPGTTLLSSCGNKKPQNNLMRYFHPCAPSSFDFLFMFSLVDAYAINLNSGFNRTSDRKIPHENNLRQFFATRNELCGASPPHDLLRAVSTH